MEEARRLGLSYGRTRASLVAHGLIATANGPANPGRRTLVPRTRQTERVRANVRASRSRRGAVVVASTGSLGPAQPSTSSGFDSISENSRGRSPAPGPSVGGTSSRRVTGTSASSVKRHRPRKKRRRQLRTQKRRRAEKMRKVRITEINHDGVLEETVTYVMASIGGVGRRKKKRKVLSDYED
jgi:hypothetical protein